jgi:hypothetical protein
VAVFLLCLSNKKAPAVRPGLIDESLFGHKNPPHWGAQRGRVSSRLGVGGHWVAATRDLISDENMRRNVREKFTLPGNDSQAMWIWASACRS